MLSGKIHKVEICVSNAKLGSGEILDWIAKEYPHLRTKRWGCLGHCNRCLHAPFVLIDDKTLVEAEDTAALREKMRTRLDESARAGT